MVISQRIDTAVTAGELTTLPALNGDGGRPALRRMHLAIALVVFLVALTPRLFDLDAFATADEGLWIARSIEFLDAVGRGDWQGTLPRGEPIHPGITTRWTGAIGIAGYFLPSLSWDRGGFKISGVPLADAVRSSPSLLAAMRLPTALIVSVCIALAFLVAARAFGSLGASIAAGLLALDPFYVGLSRILHHDALSATFGLLSVLCLSVGVGSKQRRWHILSGIAAGLACLSKSLAVVLAGVALLTMIAALIADRREPGAQRRFLTGLVLWPASAIATVFALWPSMWVQPLATYEAVRFTANDYATSLSSKTLFMGQAVYDAGPAYYPVALLLRASPALLLGLAFGVVLFVRRPAKTLHADRVLPQPANRLAAVAIGSLLLSALAYAIVLSLGVKKFDRYALPSLLALDVVAGVCLAIGIRSLPARRAAAGKLILGSVAALQIGLCLLHHPYYISYYNPLTGGAQTASKMLLVGWGEGLDQAANYLRGLPDAESLKVGSPFLLLNQRQGFTGRAFRFPLSPVISHPQLPWTQLDYVVSYANWFDLDPLPADFEELVLSDPPEYAVDVAGYRYAAVYRIPHDRLRSVPPAAVSLDARYLDGIRLAGYRIGIPAEIDSAERSSRMALPITLYWSVRNPCSGPYRTAFKLVNAAKDVWGAQTDDTKWGGTDCRAASVGWNSEVLVPEERLLEVVPGTPPGAYDVELILLEARTAAELPPEPNRPVLLGPVELPRQSTDVRALDYQHPLDATLGDNVRLLGYSVEGAASAGQKLHLTLFWQSLQPMAVNYKVFVHLVDATGEPLAQQDSEPVTGFHPTSTWAAGEIVRDQHLLAFDDDRAREAKGLRIGLYDPSTGERLPVVTADGTSLEDRAVHIP